MKPIPASMDMPNTSTQRKAESRLARVTADSSQVVPNTPTVLPTTRAATMPIAIGSDRAVIKPS